MRCFFNIDFFLINLLKKSEISKPRWLFKKVGACEKFDHWGERSNLTGIFFDPGRDSFLGVLTSHKGGAFCPGWIFGGCAVLGAILVAVTDVLRWQEFWNENAVAVLVCCRCSLKSNLISGFYAGVTFLLDGSTTNQCNSCVGDGDKDFGPLVVIVFAPVLASFNLLGG